MHVNDSSSVGVKNGGGGENRISYQLPPENMFSGGDMNTYNRYQQNKTKKKRSKLKTILITLRGLFTKKKKKKFGILFLIVLHICPAATVGNIRATVQII